MIAGPAICEPGAGNVVAKMAVVTGRAGSSKTTSRVPMRWVRTLSCAIPRRKRGDSDHSYSEDLEPGVRVRSASSELRFVLMLEWAVTAANSSGPNDQPRLAHRDGWSVRETGSRRSVR